MLPFLVMTLLSSPSGGNGACVSGTKPCDWEPWETWGPCTITCGIGYRTRTRKLCCGDLLPDCGAVCFRGDNTKETEVCSNSCPNGGTIVDGICQCPPLKDGACCERAVGEATVCARHCSWTNWHSWGICSTDCGCGTKSRSRHLCCSEELTGNGTQCKDDCNMEESYDETRVCTNKCSDKRGESQCTLCSWNVWQEWSPCNKDCGGGQRSRSRSPCCCKGQDVDDCLSDCGLPVSARVQSENCNENCFNNGQFSKNGCTCTKGYTGACCSREMTEGNCSKCSWNPWNSWTMDSGQISRTRRLCCRESQSPEECLKDCSMSRYRESQGKTCSNTENETDVLAISAGVASVISIVLTSIVWVGCLRYRSKHAKKEGGRNANTQRHPTASCAYDVPTEGDRCEHNYDEIQSGLYSAVYSSENRSVGYVRN